MKRGVLAGVMDHEIRKDTELPLHLGEQRVRAVGRGHRLDRAGQEHTRVAAPLDEAALREAFADRLVAEDRLEVESDGKVRGRRLLRLDKLTVEDRRIEKPDPAMIARALADHDAQGLRWVGLRAQSRR